MPAGIAARIAGPAVTARLGAVLFTISLLAMTILVLSRTQTYWQQTDAIVYRDAGRSLWQHPGQLYRRDFSAARLPFTYTPFAALGFAVAAGLPFAVWQIGLAAIGVTALLVSAKSALVIGGVRNGWQKPLGLAAVCLWLEPVAMTLFFGQINLVLMALVLADFALPPGSRLKGVGIGVATAVKLTPLIFIAFLLLTGRRRAARNGLVTVAATVVAGAVLLPASSWRYWTTTVSRAGDDPSRLVNQSLNGLLRRLIHHSAVESTAWLAAAAAVLVAGLLIARAAAANGRELAAVCAAAATGLLVSPVSWTHHYVYVVAALGLACAGELATVSRRAVGVLTIVCFGWWPTPAGLNGLDGLEGGTVHPTGLLRLVAHNGGRELHWGLGQFLAGNGYVWAALALLLLIARATADA